MKHKLDFRDKFFDILKWLFSFSSQRNSVTLKFFKISLKKEVYWWRQFLFLMTSSTKWFLASKLCTSNVNQSITFAITELHCSPSFHNGYCWSRFQLYAMPETWDATGRRHICFFYTNYNLFPWPLCLHTTCYREKERQNHIKFLNSESASNLRTTLYSWHYCVGIQSYK